MSVPIQDSEPVPLSRIGLLSEIKCSRIMIIYFMIPRSEGNFMLNGLKSNVGHAQAWARSCASRQEDLLDMDSAGFLLG